MWFFGLLNRLIQDIADETFYIPLLLHCLFVPMQGFWNATVYGGLFENKTFRSFVKNLRERSSAGVLYGSNQSTLSYRSNLGEIANKTKKVSLFVSTYNCAEKSLEELGNIDGWLMPGYDLYAIGLQECMCLPEIRAKLQEIIEKSGQKFVKYEAAIGSTNTSLGFHGMIAVTIFAKKSDVDKGNIFVPESENVEVKKGVDLVITTAPNKGAVGLPLIFHDTSLCFFTAHFAANSKGRNRLAARIADAKDTLANSVLTFDDVGYDSHLLHHVSFVFGDLNFRCSGASPEEVLDRVALASRVSKELKFSNSWNWREEAYQKLGLGLGGVETGG